MQELCDTKIRINGEHTFFVNQRMLCSYSGRMRRLVKKDKKRSQAMGSEFKMTEFPGGPNGFDLVSRFCYNNGRIPMSPSNIGVLHCSAIFMEMTEEVSACNLLSQTEAFLDGLFYWTWDDILTALKSFEPSWSSIADTSGLLDKIISALLGKISANSETPLATATPLPSSSSSFSSPDTSAFRCSSSGKAADPIKPCLAREWWFEDLTILPPNIIEKMVKTLGSYDAENKNLILTRFLLHYLRTAAQRPGSNGGFMGYDGLADTAIHGVVLIGRTAFSCRGLFWVLRVVSGYRISKDCRLKLESLMGLMLDQATLDDLLVSGHDGGVYDVGLVLRLVKVFVSPEGGVSLQRLKKVGRLIDKYLGEISPDQSLKVSKFLGVAESLPDSARDCFDGVYRALDIYLESHATVSSEDRVRLCQCLNYEKLTLEASKDIGKNPRFPPRVAMQALISQQTKLQIKTETSADSLSTASTPRIHSFAKMAEFRKASASPKSLDEKEELKLNLQTMQSRVIELEKACQDMKGQMSRMVKGKSFNKSSHRHNGRGLPRLC